MSVDKGLKVKVLVLGDSGVGKSSLAQLLCYEEENKNPGYTIGCSVHIKVLVYFFNPCFQICLLIGV